MNKLEKTLIVTGTLTLSVLLWNLPANAASVCKGLEQNTCTANTSCFWKKAYSYDRKAYSYQRNGKTVNVKAAKIDVKAHCRKQPVNKDKN